MQDIDQTRMYTRMTLTEDDIPGAKLLFPEDVRRNTVPQLQRWLKCTADKKKDLVERQDKIRF